MQYLGKFSGKIYTQSELPTIEECGVYLYGTETHAQLHVLRTNAKIQCEFCHNKCPVAIRGKE